MKHLYKVKNNRISGKANRGFTLVEMIVVLTIMAIMMSGAVWGVTGWIAHYEYISSEQKARTIYMAAQSALSAAESRGTLEDYMSDLNKTGEIVKFAKNPGDPGLDKAIYGIPVETDNEGEIHEYGYLAVNQGDYASGTDKALFKMLEPYVSDSEQLNASIVVEFDLTAKKVYSAFYSAWSKSIQYDASKDCVERGDFYIDVARRTPEFREGYQVGYYGADQVNVVKLDNLPQFKADCMLHNEETLYLTMSSDDDNAEEYVKYTVSLYEDPKPIVSSGSGLFGMFGAGDSGSDTNDNTDGGLTKGDNGDGTVTGLGTEKRLCNIYFEKADLEYSESDNGIPKRRDLSVDIFDPAGNKIKGTYPFIISFKKYKDDKGEDQEYFSLTLDAPTTAQSYAMLNSKVDKVTKRTDSNSYSITRLIGTKPMNIYARVSVEPTMAGVYSSGSPKDSNTENALFETKKKEYKDNEYFKDDSAYLISKNRHFTNIKYTEDYIESADASYTYAMVNDLDWNNVQIYDLTNNLTDPSSEEGYTYVDMTKENKASFPMISKLNKNSEINGCGYQYSNLILNNSSSVIYSHDNDGKLVLGTDLSNIAKTLGVVGINKGKIRRLIVANTKVNALSYDLYSMTPTESSTDEATRHALCTDSLEAVGLLCGRNEGSIREIYFDKDCAVKAYVFANLDDVEEAEADGMSDSDIAGDKYINERYACGVGMVAGTVVLDDRTEIDRIRTSGKVEGTITGTDDNFQETPEISDPEGRAEIYDDSGIGTAGRITNAQYYSYGVGGVFGYVFGKYDKDADSLGMGVPQKTVADNNKCEPEDEGYYYPLKNRVEKKKKVIDDEGNEKEVTTLVEGDILLFDEDDTRSIINKADVKGVSFTGGIAGNIFIQGLSDNMQKERDKDEDIKIPDKALTQFVNCHNYGDTVGTDFIGGVVGINGRGGYIAECSSYGSPQATKGVSAGITSENYGYISECLVDRAPADEDNANDENVIEPYIPIVKGNMQVAGAITSVNHVDCVVKDCKCAISQIKDEDDKDINTTIKISGNEMDTFGYLVGENNGVVNGGKAGDYIGYISKKTRMIIGGAVGTNKTKAVVKNVTVTAKLSDQGEAECIGGVVGLNLSKVNKCKFGGTITKKNCRSADTTVGGVVGRNGDKSLIGTDGSSDGTVAVITNSYLIGGELDVSGVCYYSETDSVEQKLARSSAVGGICGANYPDGKIDKCYISCVGDVDSDGNAIKTDELGSVTSDDNGVYKVNKESTIQVVDGMAGGIVASNYGEVCNSGYTDKVFYDKNDTFEAANDSSYKKYESSNSDKRSKEMSLFVKTLDTLDGVDNADNNTAFNNVTKLNKLFMDDTTGEVLSSVERLKGYLSYDKGKYQYALPKYAQSDVDGSTWDAYQDITNQFHLTMGYKTSGGKDVRGKGCIGGIVGFNSEYGSVNNCASGRWVVENYMPKVTYNATGGVIGNNAADGNRVRNLANFAYVRIELPQIVSEYLTDGIESNKGPDNRFHYVGGVIGTQYNKKETNWSVTKCINAGTVLNYYGHNTGGVVGVVSGMGGVVKNCYNYGTTMTGYATSINGSKSGTAGGIVSHYTDLNPDQTSEILDCQNHGIIAFPVQGLDYETNVVRNGRAVLTANDTGGIVGEISAPDSTKLYTVNIKNCVNGKNARVYAYSKCAGIVGQIGCLTKDYVNNDFMVNSIYVNIDTCRNYASNFWMSENKKKVEGESFAVLAGGISAGRDMYSGTDESKWTGYTTIRNCFSVRMSGNKDSGNYPAIDSNGVVVYSKNDKNPYTQSKAPKFRTFKYCGDNYYLDESSFQYSKRGLILSDGYNEYTYAKRNGDGIVKGDSVKVNAKISYTDSSINNKSTVSLNGTIKSAIINKINSLSLYIDNYDEQYFASDRIISVEYEKSGVRKYALMIEPPYIKAENLNESNTWISADEKKVFVNVKQDDKVEAQDFAVLYTFEEKDSPNKNASYSVNSINYFKYANMKKANDSSINNTRLPVADEYDVDYYALDKNFLSYIEDQKSKGPDNVIDVNVTEDNTYGYYKVQWDVTNSKKKASATEFDVKVNYYRINKDDEFDKDSLGTYEVVYEAPVKKAYGTTTTVETLKDDYFVDEDLYDYYVVVKVKDSRGKSDSWYSEIEDKTTPKEIKSYRILKKKMPKPLFEIVKYSYKTGTNEANNNNDQYASKWFLHLKNAEDYQKYALTAGLEVGAYQKNDKSEQNLSKTVSLSASDMFDASGNLNLSNILNAAVDINGKFDKDKLDVKLYGYAKADGYLPSDTAEFTIYMPQYADPKIKYSYTFTEEDKETLNNPDKKPEYTGSLTYEYFHESVSKYTPLTEQIFKLELYGVMKEIDQVTGEVKTWHETLASKEYPMSMGDEAKEINIGYYDMTSEVLASLSKYDSFGIDCWYARPGAYDIYNYFETTDNYPQVTEKRGDKTVRSSGYINDVSEDKTVYYFRSCKLPAPTI
ncbi:MAG: type II secretion system protein, partial [Lachnospiraceae bacterium]|nr:type II secretion system protein [Lachnospiraceae bacterium]